MDFSPGSSIHGISQARILEWVAISFSRGSSRSRDRTCISWVSSFTGRFLAIAPPGKLDSKNEQQRSWRQPSLPQHRVPGWPWSVTGLSHSRAWCQPAGENGELPQCSLHAAEPPSLGTYQSVERGNWQDAQPAQGQLGGAAGGSKEALGVRQLPALQAGQIAAHPEQIHVKLLQVLLPLLDLFKQE